MKDINGTEYELMDIVTPSNASDSILPPGLYEVRFGYKGLVQLAPVPNMLSVSEDKVVLYRRAERHGELVLKEQLKEIWDTLRADIRAELLEELKCADGRSRTEND